MRPPSKPRRFIRAACSHSLHNVSGFGRAMTPVICDGNCHLRWHGPFAMVSNATLTLPCRPTARLRCMRCHDFDLDCAACVAMRLRCLTSISIRCEAFITTFSILIRRIRYDALAIRFGSTCWGAPCRRRDAAGRPSSRPRPVPGCRLAPFGRSLSLDHHRPHTRAGPQCRRAALPVAGHVTSSRGEPRPRLHPFPAPPHALKFMRCHDVSTHGASVHVFHLRYARLAHPPFAHVAATK
jgi:hypothetical protein